ncbi:MAG: class I SAM-dependent methyltransferase [Kofleriaceae bacterium]
MVHDDDDVPAPIDLRAPHDVATWLETAETVRPWRPAIRRAIAELLRDHLAPPLTILELGPGAGLLAEVILATCTVTRYTLLDFSPPFLELCRDRLGASGVAELVLADFKSPAWPSLVRPPYDAVVTMQAVHELRHKKHAATLYTQVLPLLRPGGLIAICDHMPKGDPRSTALHASDLEQHEALATAGFTSITTHLLDHAMYVCAARR